MELKKTPFAIIIAVEEYRFSDIKPVQFARNDASKFKKLLLEEFQVPVENIITWIDKDATKSALENEIKYHIRQLNPENLFYFYYAGHGFYQNGENRLTSWDSHPENLQNTTVSLKEVLTDPLKQSECEANLIFLDTCASYLKNEIRSRDIISDLSPKEFENFVQNDKYAALFMSCSPGEKSYPSQILNHGIWTWHLIEALKGNMNDAIVNNQFITDNSLKNYLSRSVPKFITEKTELKNTQTPYTKISSSSDFVIRKIPEPEDIDIEFPKLILKFDSTILRKIEDIPVKNASGFKRNHFVPDRHNPSSNSFIQDVFQEQLDDEIQEIYENTKKILSLRRRDIKYDSSSGSGFIENSFFRFYIDVEQSNDDPGFARATSQLHIRVPRNKLPENFDDIFPNHINEIVIPIDGDIDFDELVEKFENLEEDDGGVLSDNALKGLIDYKMSSGLSITINTFDEELIIRPKRSMKCLELIDRSIEGLSKISQGRVNLLSS